MLCELFQEGKDGIRGWFAGTVEKCITKAGKQQDSAIIVQDWLDYDLGIRSKIAFVRDRKKGQDYLGLGVKQRLRMQKGSRGQALEEAQRESIAAIEKYGSILK